MGDEQKKKSPWWMNVKSPYKHVEFLPESGELPNAPINCKCSIPKIPNEVTLEFTIEPEQAAIAYQKIMASLGLPPANIQPPEWASRVIRIPQWRIRQILGLKQGV